ncbi:hypothetical protein CPB84DRAFT_1822811 [Gymnopilus junonius]|uniref:Tyrosine--tRNA ligase n=1 Tax=Gymnopilus junonius TaxID=109634 RepID=A0A9P5NV91_GYMJU|nr:hypothetical protein CPB84DRAFT_1822811 [Gymnopilus junonius]
MISRGSRDGRVEISRIQTASMWHGIARRIISRRYHSPPPLLHDLTQRGFVQDISKPDSLHNALLVGKRTAYVGIDPTAMALHIGHLIPLMCLLHFQLRGHRIIPLIGGATGRVGDPSGRLVERQLAETTKIEKNVIRLTSSIQRFFKHALLYARSRLALDENTFTEPRVISNLDWHGSFSLLHFLQTVGVHARVNTMLNRESVRARLTSQQGLSFTEFTYQLLQAYDFYHLHEHHECTIQIGGSDQWGNIVAGLELIGKLAQEEAPSKKLSTDCYGITTPLLTTSTGEKFGKSSGNAVWLEPDLTSVFDFYQYFLRVADADVGRLLKLFTFMPQDEVTELLEAHNRTPERRLAQHRLAEEVTEMVHLKIGVTQATVMTKLLFGSDYTDLKAQDVVSSFSRDPRLVKTTMEYILNCPVTKLAAKHGLVTSNFLTFFGKAAARNLVASRGLYVNNQPVQDVQYTPTANDLLDGKFMILRAGKDKMLVLAVCD